ncbi:hypothetical protein RMCBS344292_07006 [Rhizopus microsporus]|nr:hypothetical protein RMCBS344292_07006 [Rhizopus microsporus]
MITDDVDPILVKLLSCLKALVETLPNNIQQKKVQENELCTRYLKPLFQSLFDSAEDNDIIFKWTNTIAFKDNGNEDQPTVAKNKPDGCIKNDRRTIGFVEVNTINNAANHHKVNTDLYRLGILVKLPFLKMA